MSTAIRTTWIYFTPESTDGLLNESTPDALSGKKPACRPCPPDRTERSVRQRPSPLINLYDWVTPTCVETALGPRGGMIGQSSILSLSWSEPHAPWFLYIPVTATVGTRMLPFWHRNLHFSNGREMRPRLQQPLQGLPVHGPCVLFPHRWEGRGPPPLETAPKWITRVPLMIFRAYQLGVTSKRHLVTLWETQVLKCWVVWWCKQTGNNLVYLV